ncbi:MAG: hypothetical protein HOV81_26870 [Kofleriaceae bacterium]|nr:hypothetical protein [Kofleriaceae bacterium]
MRTSLLLIALLALPSVASATPAENGIFVNTEVMNGIFVNSGSLSSGYVTAAVFGDETIDGVRPTWEAYKPGHYLYYPHIEGTGLAGWAWEWAVGGWVWRSGEWFEGTVMPAGLYNKDTGKTETITVRIADVTSYAEYGVGMLLHNIEVQSKDASGAETWVPMCGTYTNLFGAQSPVPAIALRGEWSLAEYSPVGGDHISDSPYRVTFACASGALGKCAADCTDKGICSLLGIPNALGYKPWTPPIVGPYGTVLRDYAAEHQACTRMVRADYCGDGHPWTATGTQIDVYDRMGVNTAVMAGTPYWMYEATWNEDGAVRIACERLNGGAVTCPNYSSAPWAAIAPATTYWACFKGDGMNDPAARLGNLRRQTIALPPITPIHF